MTGNVWEWTADYYSPRGAGADAPPNPCCKPPANPRIATPDTSYDIGRSGAHIPRHVIKGGSHLCAASYCLRYRPAARQPEAIDTSTSHTGSAAQSADRARTPHKASWPDRPLATSHADVPPRPGETIGREGAPWITRRSTSIW